MLIALGGVMKTVKELIREYNGDKIPKGLYFVETSIKLDAVALTRLFKVLGLSEDNYYLEPCKNGQVITYYTIWWRFPKNEVSKREKVFGENIGDAVALVKSVIQKRKKK